MFITHNKVRMHDTDMAGILYFANQFRYVHDALEDIFTAEDYPFEALFHRENFIFVFAHVEADYLKPLKIGDNLDVHVHMEKIGRSSLIFAYHIYRAQEELVGTAKTVQVCLEKSSRQKMAIPAAFRAKFEKYLVPTTSR